MNVIIQCAGSKNEAYFRDSQNNKIMFIDTPNFRSGKEFYYHPDEEIYDGKTGRQLVKKYNDEYKLSGANPFNLLPAYRLYKNPIYQQLATHCGVENVFILSAGWGLLAANFLTPKYDITFSNAASWKKRTSRSYPYQNWDWADMLSNSDELLSKISEKLVCFCCPGYYSLLEALTENYKGEKILFYNRIGKTRLANFKCKNYNKPNHKTNWHYACAEDFIRENCNLEKMFDLCDENAIM